MQEQDIDFYRQSLSLSNEKWKVHLYYENNGEEKRDFADIAYQKVIPFTTADGDCKLIIRANDKYFLLTGLRGGYLHAATIEDNSQSVKLYDNNLVMSMGNTFFSVNLENETLNWKINPDMVTIFEFYDLEDDFLLRGELAVYRIDKTGNIKWQFQGWDIWVSINGKKEVAVSSDTITLTDFSNNQYILNYSGKSVKEIPYEKPSILPSKPWWKFW